MAEWITMDFFSFLKYGFHPTLITILWTGPWSTFAQPKYIPVFVSTGKLETTSSGKLAEKYIINIILLLIIIQQFTCWYSQLLWPPSKSLNDLSLGKNRFDLHEYGRETHQCQLINQMQFFYSLLMLICVCYAVTNLWPVMWQILQSAENWKNCLTNVLVM